MDPVVEHSREMIRKGSKSFAGAAGLLPGKIRDSVYMLYAWCRYCDDCIDQQDLGQGAPTDDSTGRERYESLVTRTREALTGGKPDQVEFMALQRVVQRHGIEPAHPLALLEGFQMDVERRRYHTLDDTLTYCYHVAGVVGVMMAQVMGARGKAALDRAADLGLAFQMTNIARDVMDDAATGRIYLPLDWLTDAGVSDLSDPATRPALVTVVRRFLDEADQYYRSAWSGLAALEPRSAWAIATARSVYREIGVRLLQQGDRAWQERSVVGSGRKVYLALRGAGDALAASTIGRLMPRPRVGLWTRPQR